MASEKRSASNDFGSSQMVVKRQNRGNDSKAIAVVNGSAANGALLQAVCPEALTSLKFAEERKTC